MSQGCAATYFPRTVGRILPRVFACAENVEFRATVECAGAMGLVRRSRDFDPSPAQMQRPGIPGRWPDVGAATISPRRTG